MIRTEYLDKLTQIKDDVIEETLLCLYQYQNDAKYDNDTLDFMNDIIDYVDIDCLPHSQYQKIEDEFKTVLKEAERLRKVRGRLKFENYKERWKTIFISFRSFRREVFELAM